MTTDRDWIFRSQHLRMQAKVLRERAEAMVREAERYENLANSAERIGVNGALGKLDDAIAAASLQRCAGVTERHGVSSGATAICRRGGHHESGH